MTCLIAKSTRVGFVILAGAILSASLGSDAIAKTSKRQWHARGHLPHTRALRAANAKLVSQQPVRLEPMRYYGGPKSPMWRGPVEN